MATYYVGPGGSNSNDGLSWANRKLTLTGVEDIPVAAADIVYAGPGVYPELLTLDVSGSAGNPITYIADRSGQHTDGIGGLVIITGSDDGGATITRASAIEGAAREYRTFRGFGLANCSGDTINALASNCIIGDCIFYNANSSGAKGVELNTSVVGVTVRRCIFYGGFRGVANVGTTAVDDTGHVVENCLFLGCGRGVSLDGPGGATVRNCSMYGCGIGIRSSGLTGGQTNTVLNCVIQTCTTGLSAGTSGEITEDYCAVLGHSTARVNVTAGTNSNTYAGALDPQTGLIESALRNLAGHSSTPDHDLYNNPRLLAGSDTADWGAIQHAGLWTRSSTARTGSYSRQVTGVGFHHRWVKRTGSDRNISVYTQWTGAEGSSYPYVELLDGDGTVVDSATASGSGDSWEELQVTMPGAATISYRLRLVNPNSALTVLFDK